jgi:Bacterial Ig-like domain (group 2)
MCYSLLRRSITLKNKAARFFGYFLAAGLILSLIMSVSACSSNAATTATTATGTIVSIAITPTNPPNVAVHGNLQLKATATYSDGKTGDITNTATWMGFNDTVLTVSSSGLVYGRSTGSAKVNASMGSITSLPVLVTIVSP